MKSTYTALAERIRQATTQEELDKREAQYTRHYNAGLLTVSELSRLDGLAMDKFAELDN